MYFSQKNFRISLKSLASLYKCTLPQLSIKERHYWKNMECDILQPPVAVRGMTQLQREAFKKLIKVPKLRIAGEKVNNVLPLLKKYLLKMANLKPIRPYVPPEKDDSELEKTWKEVLLHPLPVQDWSSLPAADLEKLEVTSNDFFFGDLQLDYTNWQADEIFKYVLPANEEGLTSYSRIGHIIHLNLRDHHIPYKRLIGDVFLDKIPGCRTVVNKAATIDNTYRNFQLELICGVPEYQVETKENGNMFEFDFSKVYWNPRLSTEHERIVTLLHPGDVLYDVFAGVGPFSVPAAKKGCTVLANDLNPECYKWLEHNARRNKCLKHMELFNKDGVDFICTEICSDLKKRWKQNSAEPPGRIHITMNLPAIAVEFLSAFRGLLQEAASAEDLHFPEPMPLVHVYTFAKGEKTKELVIDLVEIHLGQPLGSCLEGVHFVRNVAPNKDMYRVSFTLTKEMLTTRTNNVMVRLGANHVMKEDFDTHKGPRKRALNAQPEVHKQDTKLKCM